MGASLSKLIAICQGGGGDLANTRHRLLSPITGIRPSCLQCTVSLLQVGFALAIFRRDQTHTPNIMECLPTSSMRKLVYIVFNYLSDRPNVPGNTEGKGRTQSVPIIGKTYSTPVSFWPVAPDTLEGGNGEVPPSLPTICQGRVRPYRRIVYTGYITCRVHVGPVPPLPPVGPHPKRSCGGPLCGIVCASLWRGLKE